MIDGIATSGFALLAMTWFFFGDRVIDGIATGLP